MIRFTTIIILKDRFGVQERFIENFVPWMNKAYGL